MENPVHILTAADLIWQNGLEFGIQAVSQLVNKGLPVEYHIVGHGEFMEAIAFARHDLGLDDVIQLYPQNYRSNIDEYLIWSDIFLLAAVAPTHEHGLARAMHQGKRIVATDIFDVETKQASKIEIVRRRNFLDLEQALHRQYQKLLFSKKNPHEN